MAKSSGSFGEWGILGLLLALCVTLAVLQFRWTGELAAAETQRLGGKQSELSHDFCDRFDRDLNVAITALVPPDRSQARVSHQIPEVVLSDADLTQHIRQWQDANKDTLAPLLRIAIARPAGKEITLTGFDPSTGQAAPMDWPSGWAELQANLKGKASGTPPYTDRTGFLMEFPIHTQSKPPEQSPGPDFDEEDDDDGPPEPPSRRPPPGPRNGGDGSEMGWVILELNRDQVLQKSLPALARETLNPPGLEIHHLRVLRNDAVLFESGPPIPANAGADLQIGFNYHWRSNSREPGPRTAMWILESTRIPNLLEQTVAASRRRNLLLATGVTALILASAVLLVRQTRRARLLAQARMDFVANVSHELRTPLTVIRGAAFNLKRGIVKDAEGVARYSGMILQHTDQLSEMIQQTLDFSSAAKGKLVGTLQPLDLPPLLREALANTAAECAGCTVEVEIPENLPQVQGDPSPLRRAIQNLLVNAAKHGASGQWIGLSAIREGRWVEIRVADRGPGVPAAERSRVFEAFYRGETARSGQVRGSGLGLGLVREIVEAHGGMVSICSGDTAGATFLIRLPVAQSSGHEGADSSGGR